MSARNARESLIYGDEELYNFVDDRRKKKKQNSKLQAQIIVVLSTIMIGVLAFSAATGSTGTGPLGPKGISLTGELSKTSPIIAQANEYFKTIIPENSPVKIHEDFSSGVRGWVGGSASEWDNDSGRMRPSSLKIWKPSVKLADYRMEFEGQIEKNAMSWAFRAPDLRNYYATKIQVRKTGNLPTADIVRYAMLNGIEKDRQRLPLPISIRPDTLYHVQMSIRGNQFTTKVNGQVVDSWTDSRLKRGGVGFFSDKGESSAIHWVDVREEREGIFSRLFAMGFFVSPVGLYELE
ncbi:MAG: hypothetical protein FJW36_25095 [Acidobacteria bacterium]|nr:hypothetical protein [Acidobacteriota bacterium]